MHVELYPVWKFAAGTQPGLVAFQGSNLQPLMPKLLLGTFKGGRLAQLIPGLTRMRVSYSWRADNITLTHLAIKGQISHGIVDCANWH